MNRRHFINICWAVIILLWVTLVTMPHRLAVISGAVGHYYDDCMTSQEVLLRKEQKKFSKMKNVPADVKLNSTETLAKNLWASFKAPEAARLLLEVKSEREKIDKTYNQKLINTLLLLAGVYRDMNKLQESANYYEQIQKLDEQNLPANDARLTRDQINLAMLAYLRGDSEIDEKKRKEYFGNCLEHVNRAQIMWHAEKNHHVATLSNLFLLKYIACRELGDETASKQAYGEMKYLERQLKRPCVPPRT